MVLVIDSMCWIDTRRMYTQVASGERGKEEKRVEGGIDASGGCYISSGVIE